MFTTPEIDKFVDQIISETPLDTRRKIKESKFEDLIKFHHGYGTWIRNHFIRGGKAGAAVAELQAHGLKHMDDISMHLIQLEWKKLAD